MELAHDVLCQQGGACVAAKEDAVCCFNRVRKRDERLLVQRFIRVLQRIDGSAAGFFDYGILAVLGEDVRVFPGFHVGCARGKRNAEIQKAAVPKFARKAGDGGNAHARSLCDLIDDHAGGAFGVFKDKVGDFSFCTWERCICRADLHFSRHVRFSFG